MYILPSFIFKYVFIINNFFPGSKKYNLLDVLSLNNPSAAAKNQEFIYSLKKTSFEKITKIEEPVIYFTDEELKIGSNYLKKIGTQDFNFVCFHARDKAYLNKYNKDNRDWRYHDFRDSDIQSYLPSMEKMTKNNFFCLRMGSKVEKKLIDSNQKIIDYEEESRKCR